MQLFVFALSLSLDLASVKRERRYGTPPPPPGMAGSPPTCALPSRTEPVVRQRSHAPPRQSRNSWLGAIVLEMEAVEFISVTEDPSRERSGIVSVSVVRHSYFRSFLAHN